MKLTHLETAHICRSLAALLHAGIPLADGAFLLAREGAGQAGAILEELGNAMLDGSTLSQAMAASGCFPEHVVGMTAVGEETGRIEEALASLAKFYDQRERTDRMIRNALTYPSIVLLLMMAVIGVLLIQVLPIFQRVYASLGQQLTGVAASLLTLGQGLKLALPWLLGLLALITVTVLLYARWPGFRNWAGGWLRGALGDRGVLRRFNNARFAQALAMGLGSGLPLEESMTLAERLLEEIPPAAARCRECSRLLAEGTELSQALAAASLLAPAHSGMLSVGIRCGSSDQVMEDIAQRLMTDAQDALEDLVAKVEPAIVLACSVLVGAILLTVMLPLMGMLSAIG